MSLDTRDNLKAELAAWLRRSNITASSTILDTGITLFEAFARRELLAEDMVLEAELLTEGSFSDVQMPDDFRNVETLRFQDTPQALTMLTRDALIRAWGTQAARPQNYTLGPTNQATGKKSLRLGPVPDGEYPLLLMYNAKLIGLSAKKTSNWLLQYAPDLYLYGSLYHLLNYTRDAEGKSLVSPDYQAALSSVQNDQQRIKAPGPGQLQAAALGMAP